MTDQKIGRYEIKSELGRGGMATVYLAYDPRFERDVAIKVLPHELLHDPQFRVRFEREAKTIAALEHPAIVPVYDVGDEGGQPYFVMRCMSGGSLGDIIARGPMTLTAATKLIERIAPALDEAHYKGIVHRDLKPANILFDRTGDPYISDFGIAKMTQSQGTTMTGGVIIGTPAYMSPEQAQGEKVDGRSDVYALGVIIYEMLSGTQPYQSTTPMGIVVKHITDPIPHILDKIPTLPPAIEAVIEKAMAKNPDNRFGSAGELYQALSAVASGLNAAEALKTASLNANATRIGIPKTQKVAAKTQEAQSVSTPGKSKFSKWLFIGAGLVVLLCLLTVGAAMYSFSCPSALSFLPWCAANPAVVAPIPTPTDQVAQILPTETALPAPTAQPIKEIPATVPPATEALPTETTQPTPVPAVAPIIGGADKVAFIAGSEIWVMNLDGSGLKALTNDKGKKTRLQWIPGTNKLVFISGLNVNTVDADTMVFDNLMSFPFAQYLDEFRISPDGKQVAISLNRQMFIVPFDLAKLKSAKSRDGLVAMKGCLSYTVKTQAAIILKQFRWSTSSNLVAWLFRGVGNNNTQEDMIHIMDISSCDPTKLIGWKDEFPSLRFTPDGFGRNPILPDFDWDGGTIFLMNTFDHNGWGYLYSYNTELHRGNKENPVSASASGCCYRDARFSPDGTYIFFAFMNKDKPGSPEQFYYIPAGSLSSGTVLTPIIMPDGFFNDPKEAPQTELHRAQP